MWKEYTKNDLELSRINIDNLIGVYNEVGCSVNIKTISFEQIEKIFEKREGILFRYKDETFEIFDLYMINKHVNKLKSLHCAIKWDFNNNNIDPMVALSILAEKKKEILERYNIPIYFCPTKDEDISFSHIFLWWKPLESEFLKHGIKTTVKQEGYWEFELI